MPHLHISRHTGRVTPYIHVHRHPRFVTTASLMPRPVVVSTPVLATREPVVARTWSCGRACGYIAASIAAIGGIAAAIIGIVLLSPAVIVFGSIVALGSFAFMPVNHRYHLV